MRDSDEMRGHERTDHSASSKACCVAVIWVVVNAPGSVTLMFSSTASSSRRTFFTYTHSLLIHVYSTLSVNLLTSQPASITNTGCLTEWLICLLSNEQCLLKACPVIIDSHLNAQRVIRESHSLSAAWHGTAHIKCQVSFLSQDSRWINGRWVTVDVLSLLIFSTFVIKYQHFFRTNVQFQDFSVSKNQELSGPVETLNVGRASLTCQPQPNHG